MIPFFNTTRSGSDQELDAQWFSIPGHTTIGRRYLYWCHPQLTSGTDETGKVIYKKFKEKKDGKDFQLLFLIKTKSLKKLSDNFT